MLNQIPRKGEEELPWQKMHRKELPIGFLQPIGTPTIVMNHCQIKGRKFHPKGKEGVLVGFDPAFLSYCVLLPASTIVNSKHTTFLKKREVIFESSDNLATEELKIQEFQVPHEAIDSILLQVSCITLLEILILACVRAWLA